METDRKGILEEVTPYHWMVVIIASCGWLFDCMDQRIFVLARESALTELLGDSAAASETVKQYLGYATTSMILGWATGGIIFGMMSDKLGRVKTMVFTLVVYSGFTGLSGMATSWIDFTIYRFLVGMGLGGMFGAATTLVAESVPGGFRTVALGALQALSATGNIIGSTVSYWLQPGAQNLLFGLSGWRLLFFVGIIPSLLVIPIMLILKEPEAWKTAKAEAAKNKNLKSIGSPLDLFRQSRWRRNTLVGLGLGFAGMVGLWGIAFFFTGTDFHSPGRRTAAPDRPGAGQGYGPAGCWSFPGNGCLHFPGRLARKKAGFPLFLYDLHVHHHVCIQFPQLRLRRLLDAADDGIRPVGRICRLYHLFP